MRKNHNKRLSAVTRLFLVAILLITSLGISDVKSPPHYISAQAISACLNRVHIPQEDLHWVYVPETADELFTDDPLYFLAGQLIINKVVDASYCPAGGLTLNGYANACGMAASLDTVIIVQNLVNEPILQAFIDVGTPPVMLKQLIRYESQFWPGIQDDIHYGYGHITNIGIRNAMQWNPELYAKVCPPGVDCVTDWRIADDILNSLVATCPTCPYGVNLNVAYRSVDILAETLLGYCFQTAQMVYNATGWQSSLAVDYATIWKLTLMNYNAGTQCTYDTIVKTFEYTEGPMRWSDVSANVSGEACIRGLAYANQITTKAFDFPPP
jgi:hypothetical protein